MSEEPFICLFSILCLRRPLSLPSQPVCRRHARKLLEVTVEGRFICEARLLGYLRQLRVAGRRRQQLLGILDAQVVHIVREGAMERAVDVAGHISAVRPHLLHHVTYLQVIPQEIVLFHHQRPYLPPYLFAVLLALGLTGRFRLLLVEHQLVDGEVTDETDIAQGKLHDGEQRGDEDEQPQALAEELLADRIRHGSEHADEDNGDEQMMHGRRLAPLDVGIHGLQLPVELPQFADAQVAHRQDLAGKEQEPQPVESGMGEGILADSHQLSGDEPGPEVTKGIGVIRQAAEIAEEEGIDAERAERPEALHLVGQPHSEEQSMTDIEHAADHEVARHVTLGGITPVELHHVAECPEEAHHEGQETENNAK